MATPSLRGRLARLGNARKPILKPNKPLILTNRVGERRRERGGEQLEPWRPQSGSRRGAGGGWGEDRKAARKMRSIQENLGESGSLPPKKINNLLQRFPNKPYVS
ncbi:small ribosomal subunit protein mS37 isoform X1 [Equus przewalskii]|uniref:Small ribosomal subunit protein mS37 isoform X1 n=1 Tax=Equus przewalskii TaxID=9798 RepID=A0ABM4K2H6_EQUPR